MYPQQVISDKRAKDIAKYLIHEAELANVGVPALVRFVADGATIGTLVEAYEEMKATFNNSTSKVPIGVSYDETLKFTGYVFSFLPNKKQIDMLEHYGKDRIEKTMGSFF